MEAISIFSSNFTSSICHTIVLILFLSALVTAQQLPEHKTIPQSVDWLREDKVFVHKESNIPILLTNLSIPISGFDFESAINSYLRESQEFARLFENKDVRFSLVQDVNLNSGRIIRLQQYYKDVEIDEWRISPQS